MIAPSKNLILIGFKHVGKSTIGHALAQQLSLPFIDLDQHIEKQFAAQYLQQLSCRDITLQKGESFFRHIEFQSLQDTLQMTPMVLALGGGTPLYPASKPLLANHFLIHLTASPSLVYQRILATGRPAFFPENENPLILFNQLWEERQKIYSQLTHVTVYNDNAIATTVTDILRRLKHGNIL